jgi:preflagellin peptidase FlaK
MLDLIRFLIGIAILCYASYADLKTRKVGNIGWILMAAIGAIFIAVSPLNLYLFSIPIIAAIAFLIHQLNLFGGADAKALIAISILVPSWPSIASLPICHSIMPFPFVIFVNSILLYVAFPIYFGISNAIKGQFEFPQCLFGYKMMAEEVTRRFVWPMERIENGKRVVKIFHGIGDVGDVDNIPNREIWVTPKVPFMIPLLIGFIISFLFGDLLYAILRMIL